MIYYAIAVTNPLKSHTNMCVQFLLQLVSVCGYARGVGWGNTGKSAPEKQVANVSFTRTRRPQGGQRQQSETHVLSTAGV